MADLSTNYLGFTLKNPIIIGSCGLTSTAEDIIALEKAGAAAVVLNSVFEEEILAAEQETLKRALIAKKVGALADDGNDPDDLPAKTARPDIQLELIKDVKSKVQLPVIASIHCTSDSGWTAYAQKIQNAGADALELNISMDPCAAGPEEQKKTCLDIIKKVLKQVSVPVAVKLSDRYSDLPDILTEISSTGVAGLVLFNRSYYPDIDTYNFRLTSGQMLSCETEYRRSLQWIALMSGKIKCSIAAGTGIHYGSTVIKQILAGADAVQLVSALYLNGKDHIIQILADMEKWMADKGILSLQKFKGLASYKKNEDPLSYERRQFLKYYGRIES